MIANDVIASLPAELRAGVSERWQAFSDAQPGLAARISASPPLAESLPRVWGASEYVADLCLRRPDLLSDWLDRDGLTEGGMRDDGPKTRIAPDLDEAAFMAALRAHRHRHMLRIAWRDLAGWASLEETLAALSGLADACILEVLAYSARRLAGRHGWPGDDDNGERNELLVIAMGKLGARELNFSSDIDLVFLYPAAGDSDGPKPLDHTTWFTRQARHCIRLLDEVTAEGFVFRVDARLRPFGDSGPLVISFAALEAYLQGHGRDWERYAWVKARALGGTKRQCAAVNELLRPFVYRRYLDFGVFESLRSMKAKVARMSSQQSRQHDLKLGPGGIREIEFVVQCYQLIRGGSEPALRVPGLLEALDGLVRHGHLDAESAALLSEHYRFLRQLENRLQAQQDRQLHTLPGDSVGRARLALAMGAGSWEALRAEIQRRSAAVHDVFNALVFGPESAPDSRDGELSLAWDGLDDEPAVSAQLQAAGFDFPAPVFEKLKAFRGSRLYQRLDPPGRQRLDRLMPRLLQAIAAAGGDEDVVGHVIAVLEAVGRRSAYFALLNENQGARKRLVSLCTRSRLLAEEIAAHPLLLDELIDPRLFEEPPTKAELEGELERRFGGVAADDLEGQMEALRRFQRASMFRIAVADLNQVLPLMQVSDRLTELAELVLNRILAVAGDQLAQKFELPAAEPAHSGFGVIGYGKLGGLELGYGSDLDLVFIYADPPLADPDTGEAVTDRPERSVFCTRLAQRIVHMLSTQTRAGRLYEVDTRLRPSGQSGLLVSEFEAFGSYQRKEAWTWEHQALLRARWVAGDTALGERFARLREAVLCQPRGADELQVEIVRMRERMRAELDRSTDDAFDLKQGRGGLTDIEFLVQYLVLLHAGDQPALIRWSDNIRQLESLASAGIINPEVSRDLAEIYRSYRQRLHRLALDRASGVAGPAEFAAERDRVCDCWVAAFGNQAKAGER